MTVVSGRQSAACVAAGTALWLSTAVFDRVGSGAGTRVAFVSSWQELAGLTAFVFLVVLFGLALAERGLEPRGVAAKIPPDLFLPVVALGALVLPYLPWLADGVPAIDALAGPGRWWVWAVVITQVVWVLVAAVVATKPEPTSTRVTWRVASVGLASLAIFAGSAWRLSPGPIYPGGDEPHYLVVTQSLITDHDLDIANNHARGDYHAYYAGTLRPDYRVRGRNGVVYSIHPVGLSLLVAPAFALGGYRAASLFVVLLAALTVTLAWRWAFRATGSVGAATVGWLAVATSAPFVLHSFAIYPECAAALALILALGPGLTTSEDSGLDAIVRGLALASLPWLSTKYAPMSVVALSLVAWRTPRRAAALVLPYAVSIALWLGFFWWLYGTPLPTAPYGAAHQMSLANLSAGLPGLFADQEYGALASAPALALAVVGLWRLWRADAGGRRLALTCALPLVALALTTGAFALWSGGSAPPGRELVVAIPLLAVPLAWLWRDSHDRAVARASIEWLVIVGAALTATLVFVHDGLLIANARDGAAELLDYLDPARHLVRAAPSFIAYRDAVGVPLGVTAVWIAAAVVAWHVAGRLRPKGPGGARLAASLLGLGSLVVAAIAVPLLFGSALPAAIPVEARVSAEILDGYDALARPFAIVYSPFRVASPAEVLGDLRLVATRGLRTAPQPTRVLLNARLALPAGTYRVTLVPVGGQALSGVLGLQIGRVGTPLTSWTLSGVSTWSAEFTLDVDAGFVGFRAPPDLEARVERAEVTPVAVVNRGDRLQRPPVLAATKYGDVTVYFHDDRAYVEPAGFWVRGRSKVALTIVRPEVGGATRNVTLRLHGGPEPVPVALNTPAWSTRIVLAPGVASDVVVPSSVEQSLVPLAITVESGFVPAEHGGASDDQRLLGCWVEVVR